MTDQLSGQNGHVFVVSAARTPIGKFAGALADTPATELGGVAIRAAIDRSGLPPDIPIDDVLMGQVLQAGAGQIPARQAAAKAGIPMTVPALTINKVCLSGLDAIALADQLIRAGEFEIVVAGGMESMTNAPHLLTGSRQGHRYGDVTLRDHMAYDGLWDVFTDQAMGALTEACNAVGLELSREEQDAFSARSHQRAAAGWKNGVFDDEVVPVEIPQRKGEPVVFAADEGIRADTTVESLSRLRPAFGGDGTITAGSASQISDGACAVVVMSRAKAEGLGLPWLAEIGAHGVVAGPDSTLQSQPGSLCQGRHRAGRHRPGRDQRGVRGGGHREHARARAGRGPGQRQRRRDRGGPPDRHVWCPARPARRPRAAAARRGYRRRVVVRRRRPGRRAAHPRPTGLTVPGDRAGSGPGRPGPAG
jgi:acetyl-CoA C-acetyltransferase